MRKLFLSILLVLPACTNIVTSKDPIVEFDPQVEDILLGSWYLFKTPTANRYDIGISISKKSDGSLSISNNLDSENIFTNLAVEFTGITSLYPQAVSALTAYANNSSELELSNLKNNWRCGTTTSKIIVCNKLLKSNNLNLGYISYYFTRIGDSWNELIFKGQLSTSIIESFKSNKIKGIRITYSQNTYDENIPFKDPYKISNNLDNKLEFIESNYFNYEHIFITATAKEILSSLNKELENTNYRLTEQDKIGFSFEYPEITELSNNVNCNLYQVMNGDDLYVNSKLDNKTRDLRINEADLLKSILSSFMNYKKSSEDKALNIVFYKIKLFELESFKSNQPMLQTINKNATACLKMKLDNYKDVPQQSLLWPDLLIFDQYISMIEKIAIQYSILPK